MPQLWMLYTVVAWKTSKRAQQLVLVQMTKMQHAAISVPLKQTKTFTNSDYIAISVSHCHNYMHIIHHIEYLLIKRAI